MAASPRTEIFADPDTLISGEYKLIGANKANASDRAAEGSMVAFACWMGPRYPNGSVDPHCHRSEDCVATGGCLYNILADPTEHSNLAASHPDKLRELQLVKGPHTRTHTPLSFLVKASARTCPLLRAILWPIGLGGSRLRGHVGAGMQRLAALQPTVFNPDRGTDTGQADRAARDLHGGYWGPFVFP